MTTSPSPSLSISTTAEANNVVIKANNVMIKANNLMIDEPYINEAFLNDAGYKLDCKIVDTLQGCVYRAHKLNVQNGTRIESPPKSISTPVIIKQTAKYLHSRGMAKIPERGIVSVDEDIIKEAAIMNMIKNKASMLGIVVHPMVAILDFFESSTDYHLVMEDGGRNFYNFVINAHQKILTNQLRLSKWRIYAKHLLWQLCVCLHWLHSPEVRCCHLDISLENLLISQAKWIKDPCDPGYYILDGDLCLKLCDFGLAEIFCFNRESEGKIDFSCSKYCGKMEYLSPEIASRQSSFQANKSDIWSLGIVFFIVAVGSMPYTYPNLQKDDCYKYIACGKMYELLQSWKRLPFVSQNMLDLMTNMLAFDESKRFTIEQVIRHPWFHSYFCVNFSTGMVG